MAAHTTMPDTYVLIYTLIDEVFKINGHKEPPRAKVSDAEVAFLFIAACLDFGANIEKAQDRLHGFGAVRAKPDKGQLCRRIHALRDPILAVNAVLMELKKSVRRTRLCRRPGTCPSVPEY